MQPRCSMMRPLHHPPIGRALFSFSLAFLRPHKAHAQRSIQRRIKPGKVVDQWYQRARKFSHPLSVEGRRVRLRRPMSVSHQVVTLPGWQSPGRAESTAIYRFMPVSPRSPLNRAPAPLSLGLTFSSMAQGSTVASGHLLHPALRGHPSTLSRHEGQ